MNWKLILTGAVLGSVTSLLASQALSQNENPFENMPPEQRNAYMEYMKTTRPGPAHDLLQRFVGSWTTTTKVWMAGPDAEPSISKGKATFASILGGRYVEQKFDGLFMGQPMKGQGLIGYNNVRNLYESSWVDSMGTSMLIAKGTSPPDSNTISMYGELDEPGMDMYGRHIKSQWRFVNDDTFVLSVYDLAVSDEYLVFQIEYARGS